jgi:general secretion pathway protein A
MNYFTSLNLDREPFSNSPEPEFFFETPQHVNCLQQLEISIRLRRGLNVVIGGGHGEDNPVAHADPEAPRG